MNSCIAEVTLLIAHVDLHEAEAGRVFILKHQELHHIYMESDFITICFCALFIVSSLRLQIRENTNKLQ